MHVGSEDHRTSGARVTGSTAGDHSPRRGRLTEGGCGAGYLLSGIVDGLVEAPESEIDLRHTPLRNLDRLQHGAVATG